MIYAIRLYDVQACNTPAFINVFEYEGPCRTLFSQFEGHIHTDLLQNPSFPSMFLSIEFWTSERAYGFAQGSPEVIEFTRSLRHLIAAQLALGTFAFTRFVERQANHEGSASPGMTDQCQGGWRL
jgi:Antibiotic biosynthesis monooxygenase